MGYGVPAQVLTRYITGVETRGGRPRLVRGGLSLGKTRSSDSDHSLREVIPVGHGMCTGKGGPVCGGKGGRAYDISLSREGLGV